MCSYYTIVEYIEIIQSWNKGHRVEITQMVDKILIVFRARGDLQWGHKYRTHTRIGNIDGEYKRINSEIRYRREWIA